MSHLLSKLSNLNYGMAIHKGDASTRLASKKDELQVVCLSKTEIPKEYQNQFNELLEIDPPELSEIGNGLAADYIRLLIDIQQKLEEEEI
ncbi:hypothetical protein [Aquimarina celericrescens]|uniref:Uncharacterized protein n=1 Tax=Aquimarina celericrescens TaxID=1964542 RepID=A0ABW5AZB1_9FLAO|nr:hypothetical protein [Aquimarina celericrescens]